MLRLLIVLGVGAFLATAGPSLANDGGGGNEMIAPPTGSRPCAKVTSLRRQLAGYQDAVTRTRKELADAREALENSRTTPGSPGRKELERNVSKATDRFEDEQLGRDRVRRELGNAQRTCG